MRWPWTKRPVLPAIPPSPYQVPVSNRETPKESGIVVDEHDTSQMTQTGVFKAWKRLTGQYV
jgi:hypothetical protein